MEEIEEKKLQLNAKRVGNGLKKGLTNLMNIHEEIGDVRGLGLFLGVELVKNRETTKEPLTKLAGEVVEYCKSKGFLLSTDGPLNNVLKIKPPIVMTDENAKQLVEIISKALSELSGKK